SEADPALVANYIVALLKNNKPQEELQKICIEQLHEFLGDNTTTFVTQLFHALEDDRTLASEDDMESRKLVDAPMTVAHADSTEISSSLQNEKLPSAVVGAFAEHEEQEGSNDEDDDRNHKHTRRAIDSPSLNWDVQDEAAKGIRRKKGKHVSNAEFAPESDTETSKPSRESIPLLTDVEASTKYYKKRQGSVLPFPSRLNVDGDHRRGNQAIYNQAVGPGFDSLNGCVRLPFGRARGINTVQWTPQDSRFPSYESVDFPSTMTPFRPATTNLYTARSILNHGNSTNPPWVTFGPMPGMPRVGLKQPHILHTALQGGRGLSLTSTLRVGMGIGHTRCRDFEERGFCLRGDTCPMEHGANRIVVDDVQSLSQYNLSVPILSRPLVGKVTGPSNGPSADTARNISHEKSLGYGSYKDSEHLNVSPTSAVGIEADLYDPDQPLLNNAHPEGSRGIKPLRKGDDEKLRDGNLPDGQGNDILDVDDNGGPQGASVGLSHKAFPSVWDRIGPVDYACNKCEEGVRTADTFDGSLQHGKQSNKDLHDNQDFYSHSEKRDKEIDSDQDSGSKGVNICLTNGKVRGTSKSRVPKESGYDLQKNAETASDATHRTVLHRSNKRRSEKAQRTLYISCIPPKSNKVESLLSHFRKFGEVLGVRIPPNSDKAFVQYSCREEAEAALNSPDAVMGNRFIRLAWAHWDSSTKQENISARVVPPGTSSSAMSVSLPAPQSLKQKNCNSISFSHGDSKFEVPRPDIIFAKTVIAKELPSSAMSATYKQETLETLKLIREKQEILAQKREDFRRRLDKLAKQGIDSRGDSFDKNRAAKRQKTEDFVMCSNGSPSSASPGTASGPPSMTGNEKGGTNHISKGVMNEVLGSRLLSPTSISLATSKNPNSPTCSSFRPLTGPICSPNQFKMDGWPTAFRILPPLPYGLMDIIVLKEHFALFGDLSDVELEGVQSECDAASKVPETCTVLVSYYTRHAAERAFIEGNCWQGKKLQLAWVINSSSNAINQGSIKNQTPQNLWDSSKVPLIEKETSGGKTVPADDITNTDKTIEDYSS
ncbi:hypothetical protein KI387_040053, partial [Taxus chinensis]